MTEQIKTCSKCKKPFPATTELLHVKRGHRDGFTSQCKTCAKSYLIERTERFIARPVVSASGVKICTNPKCCKTFPATSKFFIQDRQKKDGLDSRCRLCTQADSLGKSAGFYKVHPLYHTWASMIQRCTNPNNDCFAIYGGASPPVTVCDRWLNDGNNYVSL